jgi:cell division septal protein FtsQ
MKDNRKFLDQVRAFIRVGERRWDLVLDNNLRILLPQRDFFSRIRSHDVNEWLGLVIFWPFVKY